jgi:ethanolamine kinase
MDQATNISNFKSQHDDARAKELLDLPKIAKELEWLKSDSIPKDAKVAFCHNDLLAGNIMKHTINGNIQLIDFEYGGVNFVAFDIANHFNEFAGGTENKEGQTNYDLFPCETKRRAFIGSYLRTASGLESSESESVEPTEQDIQAMHLEVQAFVLANHIYWGLWAVNQAAMEGTEEFDYMAYATNRFNQYYKNKAEFQ